MSPDQRIKWDDGLVSIEEIQKLTEHLQIVHVVNKAPLNFKSRDFVEKKICFSYKGAYYIYLTYVPDKNLPPQKAYQRARSVFGYFKIEKDPKKGWVKFRSIS